jgi:hypothetical protein
MRVIQRAADDGLNILLLKALAPVGITLRSGKFLRRRRQVLLIDIAEGYYVLARDPVEMLLRPVAGGDQGDVQFIARGLGSEQLNARQNKPRPANQSCGPKKLASTD